MARKTEKRNEHDFTRQIHSTVRAGTRFANMDNHNERLAKKQENVCCHDCRYFWNGCNEFIGRYHKPCEEFVWW